MTTWHDTIYCDQQELARRKDSPKRGPTGSDPHRQAAEHAKPPRAVIVARQRLEASDHWLDRLVACEFIEGRLILRGRVPSYYLKQLAQCALEGIEGVNRIDNYVEVG